MTPATSPVTVEDFEVGQRLLGEPVAVAQDDVTACARACGVDAGNGSIPAALQHVLGAQLHVRSARATGGPLSGLPSPDGLRWQQHRPLAIGERVQAEAVVTRRRRPADADAGTVNAHTWLRGGDGTVVQEHSDTFALPCRATGGAEDARRDFGSVPWGRQLADALGGNAAFREGTGMFDGAIELQAGAEAVQLRVYRGDVLAASRRTPAGPTFTLAGEEHAWVGLAAAPRNDYIRHAMLGRFVTSGNTGEYLRLTKAVVALWDSIRELAGLHGEDAG